MSVEQCSRFFERSSKIKQKFDDSIKQCGNIKREAKTDINQCILDLLDIIHEQNDLIIESNPRSNCDLETVVKACKEANCELLDNIKKFIAPQTYSSIVKRGQEYGGSERLIRPNHTVLIRPIDNKIDSKQCENAFKMALKNNKNIAINKIKYISNGGLAVNCGSQEESDLLMDTVDKEMNTFKAEKPKKKNPKIVIKGIDEDLKEEEIVEQIINKNKLIKEFFIANKREQIDDHLKCVFKFRKNVKQTAENKSKTNTWVLEISAQMYNIIVNKLSSVYIGFRSCKVNEYINVFRCFKCCGFGHKADECKQISFSCGICGEGHETNRCSAGTEKHLCVNCDRFNKINKSVKKIDTNHSVFSSSCASLNRIKNIIKSRINYV
jgi:hypothetical protein